MKKATHIIFISIILIEIILVLIFYFPLGNSCGSACDSHSLLNPFGYSSEETGACIMVCAYTPHFVFYIITDLFVVTLALYIVFLITEKIPAKIKNRKLLYRFLLLISFFIIIIGLCLLIGFLINLHDFKRF